MSDQLLTVADLAERWRVPESAVMKWQRTHDWPHVRLGRRYRWTWEQVQEIERSHTVATGGVTRNDGRTARSARARRAS